MRKWRNVFSILFIFMLLAWIFGILVSYAERGYDLGGTARFFTSIARFPDRVKEAGREMRTGSGQLIDRNGGDCGFTHSGTAAPDSNYLLIPVYDPGRGSGIVELVRICDGKVLHQWVSPMGDAGIMSYTSRHRRNPLQENMRFFHPLLMDDGSLIMNRGYGPLFRLDAESNIVWSIPGDFHHAIEADAEGNIWTSSSLAESDFDTLFKNGKFEDNTVVCINPAGEMIYEKAVSEILIENGLSGVLFGSGWVDTDPIHLNDVEPALWNSDQDGQYWLKGDLLLSLRNRSLIVLFRPSTGKVIWYRYGDWMNQHDLDYINGSQVSIFGNDMARISGSDPGLFRQSNTVYILDLGTDSVYTPYDSQFSQNSVSTLTEGLVVWTGNDQIIIEESNAGRLLAIGKEQSYWTFRYCPDEQHVSILSWSRFVRKEQAESIFGSPGSEEEAAGLN